MRISIQKNSILQVIFQFEFFKILIFRFSELKLEINNKISEISIFYPNLLLKIFVYFRSTLCVLTINIDLSHLY